MLNDFVGCGMPNTLAHLGAQALFIRAFIRHADYQWIFAGAVIPDVPWILARVSRTILPALQTYDLRAYFMAQSSLAISLLLCCALGVLAGQPRRALGILFVNALFHLVLDGLQEKWGSRVHLVAPLSWDGWSANWFAIASWPTYLLTALGLAVAVWAITRGGAPLNPLLPTFRRLALAAVLFAAYLLFPIPLRNGPIRADSNSVGTLRDRDHRAGRDVTLDRVSYVVREDRHYIRTYTGEQLPLVTRPLAHSTSVSVRATFADESTLVIRELHDHAGWPRDLMNYIGLSCVALAWLVPFLRSRERHGWRGLRTPTSR